MYPPELVNPMKAQLADAGFSPLNTTDEVDAAVAQKGSTLIVLNSVCGCAAAGMRPAVLASLKNEKTPAQLATSFAGVDKDAVERVRKHTLPYPPSSPCVALFVDGKLAHMVERHHIEGNTAETLADHLKAVYDQYC
jgi:putative YphP/YqiW family bacilliredoxin